MNVYVVRKKNSKNILGESAPCEDCYKKMMEIGIKNIIYSADTEDGVTIIKQRLKNYRPKTISLGRQFINNGFETIHRNKAHLRILDYSDSDNESNKTSDTDTSDTSSTCSDISN